MKYRPESDITAIELDDINFSVLQGIDFQSNTPPTLKQCDFLQWKSDDKFDLIVANPPFTNGQDIAHIRKMYDLLADGGQLITISSPSWEFREQKKYKEFREWIEEVGADVRTNENGALKSSGTNVSTVMIVTHK